MGKLNPGTTDLAKGEGLSSLQGLITELKPAQLLGPLQTRGEKEECPGVPFIKPMSTLRKGGRPDSRAVGAAKTATGPPQCEKPP